MALKSTIFKANLQIADIAEDAPVELGLTIIGAQELMVTEHSLLMSQGPCDENCAECPRRKSPHFLRDRKDYEFPLEYHGVRGK